MHAALNPQIKFKWTNNLHPVRGISDSSDDCWIIRPILCHPTVLWIIASSSVRCVRILGTHVRAIYISHRKYTQQIELLQVQKRHKGYYPMNRSSPTVILALLLSRRGQRNGFIWSVDSKTETLNSIDLPLGPRRRVQGRDERTPGNSSSYNCTWHILAAA